VWRSNVAADHGIGLTQFISMGNKADVSGNDLLEYWEHDPATRVICMYLESFGNPRRFTEIAKRVTKKKPILIVKSGRTAEGARAASHTGARRRRRHRLGIPRAVRGGARQHHRGALRHRARLRPLPAPRGRRRSSPMPAARPSWRPTP
jgi:succinyl-CoA synthetase alpha subunit